MATRYEPKDIDQILAELRGESDRAAISVGGSLLEYALELAIASRLREPRTMTEANVLFNDNGILGTFSEKIWAAYFLKVIGPQSRRDIDLIRNIRNHVSHDMNPVSFENTPEIAARCRELQLTKETVAGQKEPPDLRGKFIATIQFFAANLMLRAGDDTAEIAEAAKILAPTLDR
jgi:hypothetical protein